ncbi:hypothetical protein QLL95_gp1113 [Cotonvirus japonicus]|uniref:Ankyrin repeat protein n=1 Tax=Cotonvirus japonicus TaxID=2811091 RepID=A0ABM7NS71_9VIRU|nr:hypothetical protein QLL95_gp1113 [Cotonvirus japonicus]BCS83010.1 hypothetical protein [Cotonvirus japonicus]
MELARVSINIIKILNSRYDEYIRNECIDIIQIKSICSLYKTKKPSSDSVSLSDISFSSPEFKKYTEKTNKNYMNVITTQEFIKKYSFFVKIIYACLKLDIGLFNIDKDILILKNNYQLIKTLEIKKKQLLFEHINILKNQCRNITENIGDEYDNYLENYLTKIKIIDKIYTLLNKLIKQNILENRDNMLSLILPYFYTYPEYIEEYQ